MGRRCHGMPHELVHFVALFHSQRRHCGKRPFASSREERRRCCSRAFAVAPLEAVDRLSAVWWILRPVWPQFPFFRWRAPCLSLIGLWGVARPCAGCRCGWRGGGFGFWAPSWSAHIARVAKTGRGHGPLPPPRATRWEARIRGRPHAKRQGRRGALRSQNAGTGHTSPPPSNAKRNVPERISGAGTKRNAKRHNERKGVTPFSGLQVRGFDRRKG